MKKTTLFTTLICTTLLATMPVMAEPQRFATDIPFPKRQTIETAPVLKSQRTGPLPGFAGYYLSGRHAQLHSDWSTASTYLDLVSAKDVHNEALKRRAMVVSMGGGDIDLAARYARVIVKTDPTDALSRVFLTVHAISNNDYDGALEQLAEMQEGGMANFVRPILISWLHSAKGAFDISALHAEPLHVYHAALISRFADEPEQSDTLIKETAELRAESPSLKLADAYLLRGNIDEARKIYKRLIQNNDESLVLRKRLEVLDEENPIDHLPLFIPEDAKTGLAIALLDMSRILLSQNSTDSALVFTQMSVSLAPDLTEANILLAKIFIRSGREQSAIDLYKKVAQDSLYYEESQLEIARLLEDLDRSDEAIQSLETFLQETNSVDALILLADIKRRHGEYQRSHAVYSDLINSFGADIPDEYWFLYYARGMVRERIGQWDNAEADFKKALTFRPNDPYVLNYLGYGWAERDINLVQSLEYLEKAVRQVPQDGHIRDSLGWVLFKLGRYDEAIAPLEKAITYLPYDSTVNEHLGDAYWKVGRHREARFQWQRALNHLEEDTEDSQFILKQKIVSGLKDNRVIAAENLIPEEDTSAP